MSRRYHCSVTHVLGERRRPTSMPVQCAGCRDMGAGGGNHRRHQRRITWHQPSRHEDPAESARERRPPTRSSHCCRGRQIHVQGGRAWLDTHKLMEEVLQEKQREIRDRCRCAGSPNSDSRIRKMRRCPEPRSCVRCNEIQALRPRLVRVRLCERHRRLRRDTHGRHCRRSCHQ